MREEVSSPGIGASVSVALNGAVPTSSRVSLIGVGYNTSKVSMCASQPHDWNCASTISAFALLCGDPTWLGSAAMVFIQPPISAGLIEASNRRSRSAFAVCAVGGVCAEVELTPNKTPSKTEPVEMTRRILPSTDNDPASVFNPRGWICPNSEWY